jgi:uncharacterized protein
MGAAVNSLYVSRFLNLYETDNNQMILFHGVSGNLDAVSDGVGKLLQRRQAARAPLAIQDLSSGDLDYLRSRGHLTELSPRTEKKEFIAYAESLNAKNQSRKPPSFMMILSYDCNLACPYCFQSSRRQDAPPESRNMMTPDQVDQFFEYTIPKILGDRPLEYGLILFGGEPLTHKTAPIVERILQFTQKHKVSPQIVTNGVLINDYLDFFGEGPGLIGGVQLTLDGPPQQHNRLRGASGVGTFEHILGNIKILLEKDVKVHIRVNVDENSINDLKSLEEVLYQEKILEHENVDIACVALSHPNDSTANYHWERSLSRWSLSQKMRQMDLSPGIMSPLIAVRNELINILLHGEKKHLTQTTYCMQNQPDSFVVDNFGTLYGCYKEAGATERSIGNINKDGDPVFNERYLQNQSRTITKISECSSCSIALLCGGGCPVAAEGVDGSIFSPHCNSLHELVRQSVIELWERKQKESGDFQELSV